MCQPSPINFTHDPSLASFAVPRHSYLSANTSTTFTYIATDILVFDSTAPTPRILLLQRAASDSRSNLWKPPGGAIDDDDATLLHAAARELREEAGLEVSRFQRVLGEPQIFELSNGKKVAQLNFVAEVEVGQVKLDPNEHQRFVWASEEEVKARRVGEIELVFTRDEVERTVKLAFEVMRHGGLGAEGDHSQAEDACYPQVLEELSSPAPLTVSVISSDIPPDPYTSTKMTTPTLRIGVTLKASETCYLSNEPPFYFILDSRLSEGTQQAIFLEDGFAGSREYLPINSNQVIQCFDYETGEQVHVLHQSTQPVFSYHGYSIFTTSIRREPNDLPFITSSLRQDRKYILRFHPTTSISHWSASVKDSLDSLAEVYSGLECMTEIPALSTQTILWEGADSDDTIIFKTRLSQPSTPNITVHLSAPSTCSLSKPFLFTLTFETDAVYPITVLADRSFVKSVYSDINIRESTLPIQNAPNIIVCCDEDEEQR